MTQIPGKQVQDRLSRCMSVAIVCSILPSQRATHWESWYDCGEDEQDRGGGARSSGKDQRRDEAVSKGKQGWDQGLPWEEEALFGNVASSDKKGFVPSRSWRTPSQSTLFLIRTKAATHDATSNTRLTHTKQRRPVFRSKLVVLRRSLTASVRMALLRQSIRPQPGGGPGWVVQFYHVDWHRSSRRGLGCESPLINLSFRPFCFLS